MKKYPQRKKPKDERYNSDAQEESAVGKAEHMNGLRLMESNYDRRLKDGFKMLQDSE